MAVPVKHPALGELSYRPAGHALPHPGAVGPRPRHRQHNDRILTELGYSPSTSTPRDETRSSTVRVM